MAVLQHPEGPDGVQALRCNFPDHVAKDSSLADQGIASVGSSRELLNVTSGLLAAGMTNETGAISAMISTSLRNASRGQLPEFHQVMCARFSLLGGDSLPFTQNNALFERLKVRPGTQGPGH